MVPWTLARAAGIVVLCAAWGGCSNAPSSSEDSAHAFPAAPSGLATQAPGAAADPSSAAPGSGAVIVGGAHLEGTLGQAVDITTDTAVARLDPYDPRALRVEATDSFRGWWVMTSFPLPGGLGSPTLHPGVVLEFSVADGDNSDGGLLFPPFGCSGPSPEDFTVDTRAQHLTVTVTEGTTPGTFHMAFDEVFGTGAAPWRLRGGFDYRP